MTGPAMDRVRDALVAAGSRGRGSSWTCPAHDDHTPSLSLNPATEHAGAVLHCNTGCPPGAVLAALGLSAGDLFDEPRQADRGRPVEVARYPYVDEAGTVLFTKIRYQPKDFRQQAASGSWNLQGVRRVLLDLPDVQRAVAAGEPVYLAEGEKDALALQRAGVTATTWTEGAWQPDQRAKWRPDYTEQLRGASRVLLVADDDPAGRHAAAEIATTLRQAGIPADVVLPAVGKDASDHLGAGRTVADLVPIEAAAPLPEPPEPPEAESAEPPGEGKPSGPQPIDWHALFARDHDEAPDWLVEPLIEAGRATAVYSPPKAGKSLLTLECVAAVAAGRAVLGNPPRRGRPVLYLDFENSEHDLFERLVDLGYGPDDLGRLHYYSFPDLGFLDTQRGGGEVVRLAELHEVDLVVIDTMSRIVEGEENSADTYSRYYHWTGMPLKRAGIAVARLDHAGKDPGQGQRGSSAKSADVDYVWRLTDHDGGRLTLRREASRTNHGKDYVSITRRAAGSGLPLRHLVEGAGLFVNPNVERVMRALDELGVPVDAGRRKAKEALSAAGVGAGTEAIEAAVRARKSAMGVPCDGEGTPPAGTDDDVPSSPSTGSDISAGQVCPGHTPGHTGARAPAAGLGVPSPTPSLGGGHTAAGPDGQGAQLPIIEPVEAAREPTSGATSSKPCAVCGELLSMTRWAAGMTTCAAHHYGEAVA